MIDPSLFDPSNISEDIRAQNADIVARLSEFIADQRDRVAELDVNPIIVAGSDAVAVDALIVKA